MKMVLVAAVIGLAACGGTDPVAGRWTYQIGTDAQQVGLVDLNSDGTGSATQNHLGECFMCGPVRWARTDSGLRIDFYVVNTGLDKPSNAYGIATEEADRLTGTFHATWSLDGQAFVAHRL